MKFHPHVLWSQRKDSVKLVGSFLTEVHYIASYIIHDKFPKVALTYGKSEFVS